MTVSPTALLRRHVWMNTIELVRLPMYVLPTFAFPVLLFTFFGLPYAGSTEAARLLMSSYAAYGVLGVTLFQFGVGIAAERDTSWERFLRVLPVSFAMRLLARVLAALVFALAVAAVVILTAALLTKPNLNVGTGPSAGPPYRWRISSTCRSRWAAGCGCRRHFCPS